MEKTGAVKMNKKGFMKIIEESFSLGQEFLVDDVERVTNLAKANVSYYLGELQKDKMILKIKRGVYTLVLLENSPPSEAYQIINLTEEITDNPITSPDFKLTISLEEKNILQAIFDLDLKSKDGRSRFGLGRLKEKLSDWQITLLGEFLPKLKKLGIVICQGTGNQGEKIMEINDELFLRYTSEEYQNIVSFSDLELDNRIDRLILDSNKASQSRSKVSSLINEKEDELNVVLEEIQKLESKKLKIQEDLKSLNFNLNKINQKGDSFDDDFIGVLEKMSTEKRRAIFQKIIG